MQKNIHHQDIVIIDYNAGNIRSVMYALDRLNVRAQLTDDPKRIQNADKVIFPGVGEASTTMAFLNKKGLTAIIKNLQQPVFAICIGQQLICSHSEEGDIDCIGIVPTKVKQFKAVGQLKVPHMGWNKIHKPRGPLFQNVQEGSYVYFVHSYYCEENEYSTSNCSYGLNFSASMQKDNFYSCQFHPEKSGKTGEQIITNFLKIRP